MNSNAPMNSLPEIPLTFELDEGESGIAVHFRIKLPLYQICEYAKKFIEHYENKIVFETWHVGKSSSILFFEKL